MKNVLVALVVLAIAGAPALAGPNENGIIVVHNTGLAWSSDMPLPPGSPAPSCAQIVNEVAMGAAPGDRSTPVVWKVYAAFPLANSPRLKAVGWGISYPGVGGGAVVIQGNNAPTLAVFRITSFGWPYSGGEVGMSFTDSVRVGAVNELWWFGGYAYAGLAGEPQSFSVIPNSVPSNRVFLDDAFPANADPITGYGSLGFGQAGVTPCPEAPPTGACCAPDGSCSVTLEGGCTDPNSWQGEGISCSPELCVPSGVDDGPLATTLTVWGVPTPFVGKTELVFAGPTATGASLLIVDVSGRRVRSAWQGVLSGREIRLQWDGRDDAGRDVPSGVYLARLRSGAESVVARLVKAD